MGTKIYRVYEAFHDPAESGTMEYGYFSSPDKARNRAMEKWQELKYPTPETNDYGGLYADAFCDHYSIRVEEIEVDAAVSEKNVGYT